MVNWPLKDLIELIVSNERIFDWKTLFVELKTMY